jgi:hypothetical protein
MGDVLRVHSAALLTVLGSTTFQKLLRDWMNTQAPGARRGLTPDALDRARESSPGLLARAFAGAESSGRLGNEWQKMVETAPSDILTTLVALAPQSGAFLNRVAANLLNRPPNSDSFPTDPNWNLHNLAQAYESNPDAFRRRLAENPSVARVNAGRLHHQVIGRSCLRGGVGQGVAWGVEARRLS